MFQEFQEFIHLKKAYIYRDPPEGGRLIVKILDLRPYLILGDTPSGLVNEFWVKIRKELRRRESRPGRRFPQRTPCRGVNSPPAIREI